MLRTFDPQEFQSLDIWLLVEHIIDVQHPLRHVDSEEASEVGAPFRDPGIDYNTGQILITAVPPKDE